MVAPYNYRNTALNNGSEKIDNKPVIYFHEKEYCNSGGFNKESSTVILREVKTNPSTNKIESTSKTLSPGAISREGGTNVIVYQPSGSPQVYDKYSIAPAYRRALIASYSYSLDITCENETFIKTGDTVDVVDGVFSSETGAFTKTYVGSGKYLVLRKGYHFKREFGSGMASFKTTIQLMSNIDYVGKAESSN